jgi:hypothetical protein
MPCGTAMHRLCFEKSVAECGEQICPHCRVRSEMVYLSDGQSMVCWRNGSTPACLCDAKKHDMREQYDVCPKRPSQCSQCLEIMPYDAMDGHLVKCVDPFKTGSKKCKNDGCTASVTSLNDSIHQMTCPYRHIKCACGTKMQYRQLKDHLINGCKKRSAKCAFCTSIFSLQNPNLAPVTHRYCTECPVQTLIETALKSPLQMSKEVSIAKAENSAALNYSELP